MLPRIGLSRTSYGGISLQSLYSLQLAPQISQNWWRLPPYTTCSMRPEGGPLGQAGKPRPKGCGPLPFPRGQATLQILGGWWGHVVPNPQKSYLRLVWHQYVVGGWVWVHPCAEKKKTEKTAKQSFQPSWTEFLQGPYLQTGMRIPVFFAFIAKSTSNSTQKCEKKFSHFLDPPLEKKIFSGSANLQNHPNSGVFCFHLLNDANQPKKRAHIYSKRS